MTPTTYKALHWRGRARNPGALLAVILRNLTPEQRIQSDIVRLAHLLAIDRSIPGAWRLTYLYHVPNGLWAKTASMRILGKLLGILPGICDLHLPCPSGPYASLYLEVKTPSGKVTKVQLAVHQDLRRMGNYVAVVRSASEAEPILRMYLTNPDQLKA